MPEIPKKKKKLVNRLSDMLVSDVDIVDHAANGRRFLLFKREAGMPGQDELQAVETQHGDVALKDADKETADAEVDGKETTIAKAMLVCPKCGHEMEGDGDQECPKCGEKMTAKAEDTTEGEDEKEKEKEKEEEAEKSDETQEAEKAAISKPVQEGLLSGLREASERMMSVVTVLRAATTTEEKSATPLPNKVHTELKAIRTLLSSLVQHYPTPAAKSEEGEPEAGSEATEDANAEKQETSVHLSLLNEKFAAMSKVASSLASDGSSMSPADLEASLDQLRELTWGIRGEATVVAVGKRESEEAEESTEKAMIQLFKAEGLSLPAPVRDAVIEKLRAGMESVLETIKNIRGMETTDEESDASMPADVASAIKSVLTELGSVTEKYPSPASKSDSLLEKLDGHFKVVEQHYGEIRKAISEILTGDPSDSSDKTEEESEGESTEKGETDRVAELEKKVEELTKTLVDGKKGEGDKGEGGEKGKGDDKIPASNSLDDDGGTEPVKKSEGHDWPSDLAEEIQKRDKKK